MSSPALPPPPPSRWSPSATDPGRVDAVESLYRGTPGRSGLRTWEPTLRPPEGTLDHSWLYRPETLGTPPSADDRDPLETGAPTTASDTVVLDSGPLRWATPTRSPGRRWPMLLLLTGALVGAALLCWFA